MRSVRPALLIVSLIAALAATGCSALRGGGRPAPVATAATGGQEAEQIDIRKYVGPDYCPELRILDGAELVRRYERGHADDPAYIVWQASFGETARECLYNPQGGLTIKVGVSGRVITGPKGAPGDVSVPLKIAIVKYKEATLLTQDYALALSIPPTGSTTFSQVHELDVPSPGSDRDYIIYVGFDNVGEWDLEAGVVAAPPPKKAPPPKVVATPAPAPAQPKPPKPAQPGVLPTPSDGFVLTR